MARRLSIRRLSVRDLSVWNLRRKSLLRGTALALGSFIVSFRISGYPDPHECLWLFAPLLITCLATWDTARCMQRKWNFYHGGVILLIYVDLMILLMISFLLLAPFSNVIL